MTSIKDPCTCGHQRAIHDRAGRCLENDCDCKKFELVAHTRRKTAPADTLELFDVSPAARTLVEVEGWPDYRAQQPGGEHA